MSHDFAKKNSSPKKKRSGQARKKAPEPKRLVPAWVYFALGVACTLFVQFFIHLAQVQSPEPIKKMPKAKQQVEKQKPEYHFYDALKNQKVIVDSKPTEAREQESYNYVLQAGAFKQEQDANQLRAEITLLGLDVSIEIRKTDSGVWHKVIVGPFTSRSKLQKARSILINNDIPTMVVKR